MDWRDLRALWNAIERRDTPQWEAGKAFEHLILRAFQLDGAQVRWPYPVQLFGEEVEEIDGAIYSLGLSCLVESKDWMENVAVGPIAKLRNQLLRRPSGTVGLMFSRTGFTDPARFLAHFALPQAILLWSGAEIEYALERTRICEFLALKHRVCVEHGLPDYDIRERDIP
jgi:restriction endonuclease